MPNLERFVYYVSGVINYDSKNIEDSSKWIEHLISVFSSYNRIDKYYMILHDDTDMLHIHYIVSFTAQTRIITLFNKLRDKLVPYDTRSDTGIGIDKCESINATLRYFLHKDKKSVEDGKKQYDIDDIISNDDIDNIDCLIQSRKGQVDAYYLRNAVLDNFDDFDLMVKLTLPVYHRYRNEIQLIQSRREYYAMQRAREREQKLDDELPF